MGKKIKKQGQENSKYYLLDSENKQEFILWTENQEYGSAYQE